MPVPLLPRLPPLLLLLPLLCSLLGPVLAQLPSHLWSDYNRQPNLCWFQGSLVTFDLGQTSRPGEMFPVVYPYKGGFTRLFPSTTPALQLPCLASDLHPYMQISGLLRTYSGGNDWNQPRFAAGAYMEQPETQRQAGCWMGRLHLDSSTTIAFYAWRDGSPSAGCDTTPGAQHCINCRLEMTVSCLPLSEEEFWPAVHGGMMPAPVLASVDASVCGTLRLHMHWSGSVDDAAVNAARRYRVNVYEGDVDLFFRTLDNVTLSADGRAMVELSGLQPAQAYRFKVMLVSEASARPSDLSAFADSAVVRACNAVESGPSVDEPSSSSSSGGAAESDVETPSSSSGPTAADSSAGDPLSSSSSSSSGASEGETAGSGPSSSSGPTHDQSDSTAGRGSTGTGTGSESATHASSTAAWPTGADQTEGANSSATDGHEDSSGRGSTGSESSEHSNSTAATLPTGAEPPEGAHSVTATDGPENSSGDQRGGSAPSASTADPETSTASGPISDTPPPSPNDNDEENNEDLLPLVPSSGSAVSAPPLVLCLLSLLLAWL
jgi:hypothetical protein